MDAHHQPLAGVGALGLDQEVAAVHQGKAPAGACRLGAVGGAEDGGGIVGVAGDAPGAADALDAPAQGRALGGALGRPGAVQGDQVHGARGKVQAEGGRLVQRQREGRGVGVDRGPGDQVLGLVDRVPQLHFQPKDVPQGEGQGLGPVSVPEGGQPRQGRFACGRLRLHKGQLGGLGAVGKGGDAGGRAVVGCAGGRPLFGQQVGPAAGVVVGAPAVGQVGGAVGQAGAVVGVQQRAAGAHGHLVAGVGGVQGKACIGMDDHSSILFRGSGQAGRQQRGPAALRV